MGLKSKRVGDLFESIFETKAKQQHLAVTRFPNGCRRVGKNKVIELQTPFDWIISYNAKSALIDTKTVEGETFPHSNIKKHQIKGMLSHHVHGVRSGYVVWFRKANEIIFVPTCELYKRSSERGSIDSTVGVKLGTLQNWDLRGIWKQSQELKAV